jgi:zinc transport system substrate-binding protein
MNRGARVVLSIPTLMLCAATVACDSSAGGNGGGGGGGAASGQPVFDRVIRAAVSIAPQGWLAQRVGGDRVSIEVLVTPGQSPHTYEPTPKQMMNLSEADVFFRIGTPFENRVVEQLAKINARMRLVDCTLGVAHIESTAECDHDEPGHDHAAHDHATHDHGPASADPHIWLDPVRAKTIASNIADALIEIDPPHADGYRARLAALHAELDALDQELKSALAPFAGRTFYVFHPAYGYFADRYALNQVAIEIDGKSPGPKQVIDLIERCRADNVHTIFVQPQFPTADANAIAEAIKGVVAPMDPLDGDYVGNLRGMARAIVGALSPTPASAPPGESTSAP